MKKNFKRAKGGLDPLSAHQVLGALVAVVVITAAGFAVHCRIERLIDALEDM